MGTPPKVSRSLPECKQKQESPHTANSGRNTDPDGCRGPGAVQLLLTGDVCPTHGPTVALRCPREPITESSALAMAPMSLATPLSRKMCGTQTPVRGPRDGGGAGGSVALGDAGTGDPSYGRVLRAGLRTRAVTVLKREVGPHPERGWEPPPAPRLCGTDLAARDHHRSRHRTEPARNRDDRRQRPVHRARGFRPPSGHTVRPTAAPQPLPTPPGV